MINKLADQTVNAMKSAARSLVKLNADDTISFTKKGKGLIAAASVGGFALGAFNESNQMDRGVSDGQIYRATPGIGDYLQAPGGASGDLVFALDRNKRGGYL